MGRKSTKLSARFHPLCSHTDVPDSPEAVKCTAVGEDHATIIWEAPGFDGGAPLKGMPFISLFTRTEHRGITLD